MTIHVSSFVIGVMFVFSILGLFTLAYAIVGNVD